MEKRDTDQRDNASDREQARNDRDKQQTPRRNPRLVIGNLDFFDMLMEQDEEG